MPAPIKRLLLILFAFSPAIFTAQLMWDKTVDVGCWDSWENATLLQKWHDYRAGQMTGREFGKFLYSAQIQHRIVVPRLLVIGLTHLSGGDFRWEQYFTFLILVLDAVLLWMLLRRTLGDSGWRWPLLFVINLFLFSPIHYQVLFWASSMWGAIPMACLLGILVLLAAPNGRRLWWRVIAGILLAEIATHSFAHGLAVWPVLLLLVLLFDSASIRKRLVAGSIVALLAGATIAAYFHDFVNVAYHAYDLKPGDPAMKGASRLLEGDHLAQAVRFFFAFIGTWFSRSPFAEHPLAAARILGIATLSLFMIGLAIVVFQKRSRGEWRAAVPWLSLAAYVLLVGLMVSKRGADIGEHRAVTPRYLAISEYLLVSLLALPFVFGRRHGENSANEDPSARGFMAAALLAAFAAAQIPVWQYGLHFTNVWHHARRQAQALVLFLPHLQLPSDDGDRRAMLEVLDKESRNWHCLDAINTLRRLNLLKFKPLPAPDLNSFTREDSMLVSGKNRKAEEKAAITSARFLADGSLEVLGNARFGAGAPADAVLFSRENRVIALGVPSPRHLLRIYAKDYEFSQVDEVSIAAMYPWRAIIPAAALANTPEKLQVWVLDVSYRRVAKIPANLAVDGAAKHIEIEKIP